MKTRTLLLLALACGVAIMLAGAVFLVQLSGQDDVEPPVALGDAVTAGDMTVLDDEISGDTFATFGSLVRFVEDKMPA